MSSNTLISDIIVTGRNGKKKKKFNSPFFIGLELVQLRPETAGKLPKITAD